MQVWAGGASGATANANRLPFVHIVAFLHGKFRQMQIERQQALAVIDDHTIAFEEEGPGQDDAAAVDGCDQGARGHAEIEPLMRALHGTVKDARDSEDIGDLGIDWGLEGTFPFAPGAKSLK